MNIKRITKINLLIILLLVVLPINAVKANDANVLSGLTIMLDPGHGGKDPGAVQNGFYEKDLNNQVTTKVAQRLSKLGAKVIYTRKPNQDIYLTLEERCKIANASDADLFLSIHHDSSINKSAKGFSVHYSSFRPGIEIEDTYVIYKNKKYPLIKEEGDYFYFNDNGKTKKAFRTNTIAIDPTPCLEARISLEFANNLQANLNKLSFVKPRLSKPYDHNLYVTRWTNIPSALIEVGFVSNPQEVKVVSNPKNQDTIADKIVDAIVDTYTGVAIEDIKIVPSKVNLAVGSEYQLSTKITPKYAFNKDIIWESKNPEVVTINQNGKVKALKEGEAIIVVTTKDGKHSDQITVTVSRYSDVPKTNWAYGHIEELSSKKIINGYTDGTFKPNNNVTRAQAAVLLVKAAGIDYKGKTSDFTDVPEGHWASPYIAAAKEAGIINGYGDKYKPNEGVTRAQIAVMASKAFNLEKKSEVKFSDVPSNHWASKYIEVLASNKIVSGYEDGRFKPNNFTTRAQFSVMLNKLMKLN